LEQRKFNRFIAGRKQHGLEADLDHLIAHDRVAFAFCPRRGGDDRQKSGGASIDRRPRRGGRSDRRRAVASALFYRPGTATDRALQAFYDMVELPLPTGSRTTESRMLAPGLPMPAKSS